MLAVKLDSTERADIPPFGGNIDYLTFGGIYRDVALRVVPATFIENVFAQPVRVLGAIGRWWFGALWTDPVDHSDDARGRAARWRAA